jgi:hypothetical protein
VVPVGNIERELDEFMLNRSKEVIAQYSATLKHVASALSIRPEASSVELPVDLRPRQHDESWLSPALGIVGMRLDRHTIVMTTQYPRVLYNRLVARLQETYLAANRAR